ncbi:transcriptional regulator, TetR family [Hydrogenobaculum sp. Y04AAS1]|uniref:TetR family transcriptional regulator n=1 Tax=Hydrogenobaculum sp. (strain Y04AAS1) TaxID=380749 RepID=UPI00015BC840|nr:transcriptional regulator, TetR family [Hydrogenobaculum sp. Y04AAS1]HCT66558.1 TetR/AcrR family transcriptional regulator [Hydrogenobaculum sp.]
MPKRTRNRILHEALKIFSNKGIRETTIKDIARAVGITEGAIYRHFDSKEQIVKSLFLNSSQEFYNHLSSALSKAQNFEEALKNLSEAFLNYAFTNPEAFKFINLFHYFKIDYELKLKDGKMPKDVIYEFFKSHEEIGIQPEYATALFIGTLERIFLFYEMGFIDDIEEDIQEKAYRLLLSIFRKTSKEDLS